SDSFAFLGELSGQNSRAWMTANRDRYQFALREPLVELCRAVADRYIRPVQWVTFYRKSRENKRADAQFFVRVAPDGVRYGFHLGRSAREAGGQFRKAIQEHGEAVFRALSTG